MQLRVILPGHLLCTTRLTILKILSDGGHHLVRGRTVLVSAPALNPPTRLCAGSHFSLDPGEK